MTGRRKTGSQPAPQAKTTAARGRGRPRAKPAVAEAAAAAPPAEPTLYTTGRRLETARTHWQYGAWEDIAALDEAEIAADPDRAKLMALVAGAQASLGQMQAARAAARQARDWGCDRAILARVLISAVHNSLAVAALGLQETETARQHFRTAIELVEPRADAGLLARTREIRQAARAGLLPDAVTALDDTLARVQARPEDVNVQLGMLREDMEVVRTELALILKPNRLRSRLTLSASPALHIQDAARDLPDRPIVVACHHKSGTALLRNVFKKISAAFDLPMWMKFYDSEPERWSICFHQHSRISEEVLRDDIRGVHCVRHPIGLVHSATLYHQVCREPWVDVPLERFGDATFRLLSDRDAYNIIKDPDTPEATRQEMMNEAGRNSRVDSGYDFAGRTYRQMLADAPGLAEKLLFEMRCFSRGVIEDMVLFPNDVRFYSISLEEISHNARMTGLRQMFRHLGFRNAALQQCLKIARNHSLWANEKLATDPHVTTGVSETWQEHFHGRVEAEFRHLFGWPERALGYER